MADTWMQSSSMPDGRRVSPVHLTRESALAYVINATRSREDATA